MIFATVGTQLPFDRLLAALDDWAAQHPDVTVLAQTGVTKAVFPHLAVQTHIDQTDFRNRMEQAQVIVAHAGMGTILMAAELGKPLILMPRRADLGEHRNDHQLDTAAEMAVLSNVTVVEDAAGLAAALDRILSGAGQPVDVPVTGSSANAQLVASLSSFIWPEAGPRKGGA